MSLFGESASEAWRERFGGEAPEGAERVAPFLTHRSVRDFSPEPIDEATLAALVGAAQSAATSSNLHAYSLVSVDDPASRRVLRRLVGDQKQVEECARFLAFVIDLHR